MVGTDESTELWQHTIVTRTQLNKKNQMNFSFDSGKLDIKYFAFRGVSLLTKKLEKSVII